MSDTFHAVVIAIGEHAEPAAVQAAKTIESAGHTVTDRHTCTLEDAMRHVSALGAAGAVDFVCVVGGDGSELAKVSGALTAPLPVLSTVYAVRRFREAGGNALGEGFAMGRSEEAVVIAVPADDGAIALALGLVLPALPALCGGQLVAVNEDAAEDDEELIAEVVEEEEEAAAVEPDHTTVARGFSLGSSEMRSTGPSIDGAGPGMNFGPGWQKWVQAHDAEILRDRREELPNNIDELAPVLQILHTAGEQAVLKIGRNKMSLWGWPDLQRSTSKVIAVGWGLPFVEVVALHRHPTNTGLAIEEERALAGRRSADLDELTKSMTGRRNKNAEGELFAVEKGRVWTQRDSLVYEWDGKKERNVGSIQQALASLLLSWSQR
jgi:hypothetical protein